MLTVATRNSALAAFLLTVILLAASPAASSQNEYEAAVNAHLRGEYEEAYRLFTNELSRCPATVEADDTELILHEWIARALFDSGSFRSSLFQLDRGIARACRRKSERLRALTASRGALLLELGIHDDAVRDLEEALAGATTGSEKAELHFQAGSAHAEAGRPRRALEHYESARLMAAGMTDARDSRFQALVANDIGLALYELADYVAARRELESAVQLFGADTSGASTSWQNLALVSGAEGDYDRGIREITQALLGADPRLSMDRGVMYFNRGLLRDRAGADAAAVDDYNRAIGIFQREAEPGYPIFARVLVNLAAAHRRRGDSTAADRSLRQAEEAVRQGGSRSDEAMILEHRALARAGARDFSGAKVCVDSALRLSMESLGFSNDQTLNRFRLAAAIDSELGETSSAILNFDSYVKGMEELFRRLDWKKAPIYTAYTASVREWCAWLRGRGDVGMEKAMEYEERVAGVRTRSMALAAAGPEELADYARVQEAEARAARVATRQSQGASDARSVREALNEAAQAWEEFLRRHRGIRIRVPDLRTIRRNLGDTEAFIRFAVSESSTVAYVVSREGIRIGENRELGRRALRSRVIDFVSRMHDVSVPPSPETCEALFDDLFGDLAEEVRTYRHVFILPDGMLYHLPFDALDPGRDRVYRPWVADAAIEILPNLQRATPPPVDAETTLIYAAPTGAGTFLPGALEEARAVSALAAPAIARVGGKATESGFRSDLSSSWRAVHFACHATARGIRTDELSDRERTIDEIMVSNYLWLAPTLGDEATSSADGKLTLREIRSLDPDVAPDLVVLSACQTAMGEAEEGLEILSVADAFHSIGVRHLIATLWPVYDRSSKRLFTEFYRIRSEGVPDGLALAAAKKLLALDPAFAHPVHWSGVVLYRPGW